MRHLKRILAEIRDAHKNPYTTTRWAIFQIHISFSLFMFAIFLALLPIFYEISERCQVFDIVASIILSFMIIAIIAAIVAFIRAIHLASIWLDKGSEGPTATKEDLARLEQQFKHHLNFISKNIKGIDFANMTPKQIHAFFENLSNTYDRQVSKTDKRQR